jgi:GTP diphosphokinase / guanosine-3',5'-bis(diphosphate) 3'-diphosphatase
MNLNIKEEEEKRKLMNTYRTLLRVSKGMVDQKGRKLIRKAFNFSIEAHKGSRRKSGELYIFHPLETAIICSKEIGLGTTSIVSALLHDVVEDTEISLEEIEAIFGEKVAGIINGLTKIKGFIGNTNSIQAENFRKILLTMADDVRVILIKIADRTHNMRTLESLPKQTQLKIASETLELFAPLANRLGLFTIKSELEDLCLKYTEPTVFQELDAKIKSSREQINKFIRTFTKPIQETLDRIGMKYNINGRVKSHYSIYKKMRIRQISFNQIYDLFAVRIIIEDSKDEKADCWKVYSIVTDFYKPNPERLRDWVSTPKANGYESLHTTVMGPGGRWVEVQIRSRRMDDIAEMGYAAHWKYKEGEIGETALDDWIKNVSEILKKPDYNALEFFDEFKMNLFTHEVLVFTPKGDMITLPAKASALDMAFQIHTDLGLHCLGAKVNNKLVPLSYELKNGDQVEIITSNKKQKITHEWYEYVITARAKSAIKQALKEEQRIAAGKGKEILSKKLHLFVQEQKDENLQMLIQYFQLSSEFELFHKIGNNQIDVTDINNAIKVLKLEPQEQESQVKSEKKSYKEIIDKKPGSLVVGESTDFEYSLASCCNPIPGDDIFGFVTIGEGIKIHRTNCPTGIKLMSNYGYRIINAQWASSEIKDVNPFPIGLHIKGFDIVGLVSNLTNIISKQMEINMSSLNVHSNDGAFEGSIIVEVYDTEHLDKLIKALKKVEGIESVTRFHVDENTQA